MSKLPSPSVPSPLRGPSPLRSPHLSVRSLVDRYYVNYEEYSARRIVLMLPKLRNQILLPILRNTYPLVFSDGGH